MTRQPHAYRVVERARPSRLREAIEVLAFLACVLMVILVLSIDYGPVR